MNAVKTRCRTGSIDSTSITTKCPTRFGPALTWCDRLSPQPPRLELNTNLLVECTLSSSLHKKFHSFQRAFLKPRGRRHDRRSYRNGQRRASPTASADRKTTGRSLHISISYRSLGGTNMLKMVNWFSRPNP